LGEIIRLMLAPLRMLPWFRMFLISTFSGFLTKGNLRFPAVSGLNWYRLECNARFNSCVILSRLPDYYPVSSLCFIGYRNQNFAFYSRFFGHLALKLQS
jgi:hypothetical protein